MAVKLLLRRSDRTNPVIWALAIVCTGLVVAVILTGIAVFVIYLVYQPKAPSLRVASSHLYRLEYDQTGLFAVELALTLVAENPNARAHATFSDFAASMRLDKGGVELAELRADELGVEKNGSATLDYVVRTEGVPLDEAGRGAVDGMLKEGVVGFELVGEAKARWRVGVFASVRLLTHLMRATVRRR
ncbi:hypothetical protein HPP92_027035 [Vanilla planifolia]|uniref:Late embryogenesis abundant protein LEA-2 subgroup domain-containing protein n=1 Tax=Vanilla planifolia TaxID=51239 RepID=A0A835PEB7_VANPL|nr:hypothetical protein HPP92_027035 [Vanilla planifolia]